MLYIYLALLLIGSLTVFAVNYVPGETSFFNLSDTHGRQLIWMVISLLLGFSILTFDSNFFTKFAPVIYIVMMLILLVTVELAHDINGARSWLAIGPIQFQPAEFAKTATGLMLAKYLSGLEKQPRVGKNKFIAAAIIGLPFAIIVMQKDMGSALVFASFTIVLFREGFKVGEVIIVLLFAAGFLISLVMDHLLMIYIMSAFILLYVVFSSLKIVRKQQDIGISFIFLFTLGVVAIILSIQNPAWKYYAGGAGIVCIGAGYFLVRRFKNLTIWFPVFVYLMLTAFIAYGTDFIMHKALEPHQATRVLTLVGKSEDPDETYNVDQSKMTIGSGGLAGKGFLHGTLTQANQVPEQSTDFIFCTIAEEFGFLGTSVFLLIYLFFLLRVIFIAERQRSAFSRVYIYSVASIFFIQIMINVGMTIGLVPVIGIPLPFISYGGSSVLSFSIMIFIMLRLDADRLLILR